MPDHDTKRSDPKFTSDGPDPDQLPKAFDLLKPSWQAIKLNLVTIIEFIFIPILLSLLPVIFERDSSAHTWSTQELFNIVPTIISLIVGPGLIYTLLQGAKGKSVDFLPALSTGLTLFWRFLAVAVASVLIIGIGFCCLIIPGIYMLRRYYLAPYYLIDRNLSFVETMRTCKNESKQFTGPILRVVCVQLLFGIILIIPILGWVAGIILSVMYYNAPAIRYLQITDVLKAKPAKAA